MDSIQAIDQRLSAIKSSLAQIDVRLWVLSNQHLSKEEIKRKLKTIKV